MAGLEEKANKPLGAQSILSRVPDARLDVARLIVFPVGFWSCFGLIISCCDLILPFWNINVYPVLLCIRCVQFVFYVTEASIKRFP